MAVLVIISGLLTALDMVAGLALGRLNLNLAILNIWAGWALLSGRGGWRWFLMLQTWCLVVAGGLMGGLVFTDYPMPPVTRFGDPLQVTLSGGIVFVTMAALVVTVWVGWVLTRPDIRAFLAARKNHPPPQKADTP